MTVYDIDVKIREIQKLAGDDEAQHSKEDALWEAVLEEIAKGHKDSALMAQVVLETRKISFARWCA